MSAAQVHLSLLHFPIAGVFFGLGFLAWGLIRSSQAAKKAGLILFFVSGITSIPVFLSGEGAEEIVEDKPLVTESIIENHEEAAELAFYMMLVLSALSIAAYFVEEKKHKYSQVISLSTLVFGIVSALLIARAAHLGGMIRHDELRSPSEPEMIDQDREQ